MENSWWSYVQSVAGPDTQGTVIAAKAGFDKSAITRWRKGSGAQAEFVVKFARAYGRPVTEALAAAGLITHEEADVREVVVGVDEALKSATLRQVVDELRSRLDEVVRLDEQVKGATVTPIRRNVSSPSEDEDLFTMPIEQDAAASTDDTAPEKD